MSVICRTHKGWVISHYDYTKKIYTNVHSSSGDIDLAYNRNLFEILTPLMRDQEARNFIKNLSEKEYILSREVKKRARSSSFSHEINLITLATKELIERARKDGYFRFTPTEEHYIDNNKVARNTAELYRSSILDGGARCFSGGNSSGRPTVATVCGNEYLIPFHCCFVSCDVDCLSNELKDRTFDFILIDPPWWNKCIRRKKAKNTNNGYSMMSNADVQRIPVNSYLNKSGLVGVWCTNAPSHIEAVTEQFFRSWGLKYAATWYWIKVTQSGDLVRPFGQDGEKKPYERILFGYVEGRPYKNPLPELCVVSVPSAIHSHKPPLVDILSEFLPDSPSCLELFARYLVPGWTSVGNQVLDLQYFPLYESLPPTDQSQRA